MTPEDIRADKRLQRTYGITLQEYDTMLHDQEGGCAICRRPPNGFRLSVDHDHKIERTKVKVYRDADDQYWVADAMPYVMPVGGFKDKKNATTYVKTKLKRMSLRGILCWRCNTGLQKYGDKPERFEAAARYLRKFEETCKSAFRTSGS